MARMEHAESHTAHVESPRRAAGAWLDLDHAAAHASVHPSTLRRAIRAGELRAVRVGGRKVYRLRPEWVDEWLEAE